MTIVNVETIVVGLLHAIDTLAFGRRDKHLIDYHKNVTENRLCNRASLTNAVNQLHIKGCLLARLHSQTNGTKNRLHRKPSAW